MYSPYIDSFKETWTCHTSFLVQQSVHNAHLERNLSCLWGIQYNQKCIIVNGDVHIDINI